MTITKVKLLAAAVLVAGGLATGFGASFFANADAQSGLGLAPPAPAPAVGGAPPAIAPAAPAPAPKVAPPAAPMAGGAPMVTGGGIARGPIVRPFEYKFVDVAAMGVEDLKKTLATEGDQGWELTTIEHRLFDGSGAAHDIAIFKKSKPPAVGGMSGPLAAAGSPPVAPSPGGVMPGTTPLVPSTNNPFDLIPKPERPLPVPTGISPTPTNSKLHTISLSSGNSTQMAKVLKELIAIGEFNNEVTAVIADEGSNSLLVKATENGKKLIEKQVQQLEKAAAERAKRGTAVPTY